MVAHYKVISRDSVESVLAGNWPWFQKAPLRGDDHYFAVCPWCNNPIQLKGLYRKQAGSPRPYGSHTGEPVDGFPYFNMTDLVYCPYRLKQRSYKKTDRRPVGEAARRLVERAVSEFDRIILVLREDFGFPFSSRFAEKMLDLWFSSQGYCYTGAHLRNLPWMIAYFGPTESIYGQYIGSDTELVRAIIKQVSGARITPEGQLRHDGTGYFNLKLQCLHHRMTEISAEGMLSERMTLRVMDFSATNFAGEAPALYEKKIRFDPERFERLIHTAPERARRNRALLDLARQVAEKWRPTTHGDNA